MGQPMARRLAQAGFSVIGFNRTRSRAEALLHEGIEVADTPQQACGGDLLISMVSDDEAVEQLFWGSGRFLTMNRPGLVHAGMSSIKAIANPFIKSALMSAASADRLGVAAPLAHQIASQGPPLPLPLAPQ
jgi:3-hydroxyisobutyrate dehydrogenase-like beta-hydroxyacid dehydrogenase